MKDSKFKEEQKNSKAAPGKEEAMLDELKEMDAAFITPQVAAQYIGCDPH